FIKHVSKKAFNPLLVSQLKSFMRINLGIPLRYLLKTRQAMRRYCNYLLISNYLKMHICQWTLLNNIQLEDRKSTRLNSSHVSISYAVFCLKKKNLASNSYIVVKDLLTQ